MKGQIDIEFIIAISVFVIVVSYIMINSVSGLPKFHAESNSLISKTTVFQISEILLFNQGSPSNWETLPIEIISRIGLNENNYVLNNEKVNRLANLCNNQDNYERIRDLFGLNSPPRGDILIAITQMDGNVVVDCKPNILSNIRSSYTIDRFAVLNNEMVKINVKVVV